MQKFNVHLLSILLIIFTNMYADWREELEIPQDYSPVECTLVPRIRRPDDFGNPHPRIPFKFGTSTNWSGYASLTHLTNPAPFSVTKVTGRWQVPAVMQTPKNSYTAIWVGIDGYLSETVEQLGTEHDWYNGKSLHYAWFEMYPDYAYEIQGFPVHQGDSITATVIYIGGDQFTLSIMNNTKKVFYIVPPQASKSAVSTRSSAEWIVEAPWLNNVLPLSHFTPIHFSNCYARINNVSGAIKNNNWNFDPLTMITSAGIPKAIPSKLTNNDRNFTVVWKHL